jgi:hypothetical protein
MIRGEYKIKDKHIIKLSKLYEEVKVEKEKEKKEVKDESNNKCR